MKTRPTTIAESTKLLRGLFASEDNMSDELYHHFDVYNRWDWCEIATEARRLWRELFDEKVEEESYVDSLFHSIVAAGADGAYAQVAGALGVHPSHLRLAVAEWSEDQDANEKPVGWGKLKKLCAEYKAEYPNG